VNLPKCLAFQPDAFEISVYELIPQIETAVLSSPRVAWAWSLSAEASSLFSFVVYAEQSTGLVVTVPTRTSVQFGRAWRRCAIVAPQMLQRDQRSSCGPLTPNVARCGLLPVKLPLDIIEKVMLCNSTATYKCTNQPYSATYRRPSVREKITHAALFPLGKQQHCDRKRIRQLDEWKIARED
jgi:hypothetical protein